MKSNAPFKEWSDEEHLKQTTAKLTLALEAVEAAKGIVAQVFFPHDEPGVKFCTCCHRPVRDDGKLNHKGNCEVEEFLKLVKQLEVAS